MEYEINYLVLQSKTNHLSEIREKVKKFIEDYGIKIIEEQEFLKRKLAYEINHERFGFYTVLRFEIEDDFQKKIQEIQNRLNLSQDVARYIIVNAKELPALKEMNYKQDQNEERKEVLEKKTILKPEEAQEILSDKEKEKKEEEETATSKDEVKREDLDEELKKKKEDESGKDDNKIKKDVKDEETEMKKDEENKNNRKEETTKESDKKDKRVSLDNLDDKLDEILNI